MSTHVKGPMYSANGFISGTTDNVLTGSDAAAITATAAEIDVLHSVTPGTVAASSGVVVDASKNVDNLGIKLLRTGATPVAQVDPASCTITAAAGASNVSTITVTLKDGGGNTLTRVHPFKVYMATTSSGLTLAAAASTGYAVTSGGVTDPTGNATITNGIAALSSASGACVLSLTDTGKTTGNLILVLPTGIKASAAITSGSYGA
jgi:hypothetical protein